jgi:tetrathionate reductase subunit B
MDSTRRKFLATVATTIAAPVLGEASAAEGTADTQDTPRWVMVIDLRKCIGCQACTVACSTENRVPPGQFRTLVSHYEVEKDHQPRSAMLPRLCNHCENPPCIPVCPVQATYQRPDGIVVVDNTRCVGCAYCVQACPYDARFINHETKTADKCTFCVHRVQAGLLPACVETCVGGARIFGNINDPRSEVSRLINSVHTDGLQPGLKTRPQVYYIGLDNRLQNKIEGVPSPWMRSETLPQESMS